MPMSGDTSVSIARFNAHCAQDQYKTFQKALFIDSLGRPIIKSRAPLRKSDAYSLIFTSSYFSVTLLERGGGVVCVGSPLISTSVLIVPGDWIMSRFRKYTATKCLARRFLVRGGYAAKKKSTCGGCNSKKMK